MFCQEEEEEDLVITAKAAGSRPQSLASPPFPRHPTPCPVLVSPRFQRPRQPGLESKLKTPTNAMRISPDGISTPCSFSRKTYPPPCACLPAWKRYPVTTTTTTGGRTTTPAPAAPRRWSAAALRDLQSVRGRNACERMWRCARAAIAATTAIVAQSRLAPQLARVRDPVTVTARAGQHDGASAAPPPSVCVFLGCFGTPACEVRMSVMAQAAASAGDGTWRVWRGMSTISVGLCNGRG